VRVVVTGAAGFIGSQLSERLVADGVDVTGIDAFTDFYDRPAKEANLAALGGCERFELIEADLRSDAVDAHLEGADAVVHLAAQPGVRDSWGRSFEVYVGHNVLATQRILDAAVRTGVGRVVFASSSSIYGAAETLPTHERIAPLPISPYGVTKLAGESLLGAYRQLGISSAALRYFTVYGPRQRPDMAIRRFIAAALVSAKVSLMSPFCASSRSILSLRAVTCSIRRRTSRSATRTPPPTLYTEPGRPESAAARVADTMSSTKVKSRVCSPSP
jgi:nucleoside-diphosphate-sugar epimerase